MSVKYPTKPWGKSYRINTGDRFGLWTVLGEPFHVKYGEGRNANYPLVYPCQCDCGTKKPVRAFKLLSNSRSCGCSDERKQRRIHNEAGYRDSKRTRLYQIWSQMRQRCHPKRDVGEWCYHRYGGRGIKVCKEWRNSYVAFRGWALANGYQGDLQIDRIDNDGNYTPENCRWVTDAENKRNCSRNHWLDAFGETKCVTDWALDPRCKVKVSQLRWRIQHGWDPEKAVLTSTRKNQYG